MTNAILLSRSDAAPVSPTSIKTDTWGVGRAVALPITDAVTVRPEEPIGRAIRPCGLPFRLLGGILLLMALVTSRSPSHRRPVERWVP